MEIFTAIVIGLASSISASIVLLLYIRSLRPKILISPYIAEDKFENEPRYVFKLINVGSRDVINIKIDVELAQLVNVEGGQIYKSTDIPLVKNYLFQLSKFDRNDNQADFAARFASKEDLGSLWQSEHDYIVVKVIATDSFSGFSASFIQDYRIKRRSIVKGTHKWGAELDVT